MARISFYRLQIKQLFQFYSVLLVLESPWSRIPSLRGLPNDNSAEVMPFYILHCLGTRQII